MKTTLRKCVTRGLLAAAFVIGINLATTPAPADPLNLTALAVTNIGTLANGVTVSNINATFAIVQNAQTVISFTAATLGTNSAGSLALGFNLTDGDGNYTTAAPVTVTGTFVGTNQLTAAFVLSWTNFTGYAKGRLDTALLSGATNATVTAVSVSQKTIQPF